MKKYKILIIPLLFYGGTALGNITENVNFNELAKQCSKDVHQDTLQAIVRTESGFNPYAIGVVGGSVKQPKSFAEAVETANKLHEQGKNFSMGLSQINRYNLDKYDLNYETVFDPCKNLQAGAEILKECFSRAGGKPQDALQKALSCYYSGNFRTGFTQDFAGLPTYVDRIKQAAGKNSDQQIIKLAQAESLPPAADVSIPAIDPAAPAPVVVKARRKASAKPKPKAEPVIKRDPDPNKPRKKWDAFGDF